METSLDKFGRIVIPKRIRDEIGLAPGSLLKIEKNGRKILVEPVDVTPRTKVEGGVLVFQGEAMKNAKEIRNAVTKHRKKTNKRVYPTFCRMKALFTMPSSQRQQKKPAWIVS